MNKNNEWIAEGFSFTKAEDANLASTEKKKIEYLEAHMDYADSEGILKVYEKALTDRTFKTPVGIMYLKQLQDYLQNSFEQEEKNIPPIPIYVDYHTTIRKNPEPVKQRIKPSSHKKKKINKKDMIYPISIILNIALIIAMIAMFRMTLRSEEPNFLNYKRVVSNEFAAWEQDLTQREQIVREKERELLIQNE